jgi:hypothetical protein
MGRARDKQYRILITGRELEELKGLTWGMSESFGLDERIDEYQGKRPIGLYPWDLDCLEAVLFEAVRELEEGDNKSSLRYKTLVNLHKRINVLHARAYGSKKTD